MQRAQINIALWLGQREGIIMYKKMRRNNGSGAVINKDVYQKLYTSPKVKVSKASFFLLPSTTGI